jgi:hypothetical protein
VLTTLDTGASTTDLNANFANTFPQAVQGAKKGTADITGVGGTQTFDSLEIAEVIFGIGPAEVVLRPATITLQRVGLHDQAPHRPVIVTCVSFSASSRSAAG